MGFIKKSWPNRQVEYPGRRELLNVETQEIQIVDVARAEGNIIADGKAFASAEMEDLEERIAQASTIDATSTYSDGILTLTLVNPPSSLPGRCQIRFTAPATYTEGDRLMIGGELYDCHSPSSLEEPLPDEAWAEGALVTLDIDMVRNLAFFKIGSGGAKITGAIERALPFAEMIDKGDPVKVVQQLSNKLPEIDGEGSIQDIAWSPSGEYLAVAKDGTPGLLIFKKNGVNLDLLDPPDNSLRGGRGVSWSPDSNYVCVVASSYNPINVFKRVQDSFSKIGNFAADLADAGNGCSWSPDGKYLAIATHTTNSPILWYLQAGDEFTKLANPSYLAGEVQAYDCEWSPDGNFLAVTTVNHSGSSYNYGLYIFQKLGNILNSVTTTGLTAKREGQSCSWSPDGKYLFWAFENAAPYMQVIKRRESNTFAALSSGITSSVRAKRVRWSLDGRYLCAVLANSAGTPLILLYENNDDDTFAQLSSPEEPPSGQYGQACSFGPDRLTIASSGILTSYLLESKVTKVDNHLTSSLMLSLGIGYTLERGAEGEEKKVSLIWHR